jgi:formamidopyrimidine-DNA glycosylase
MPELPEVETIVRRLRPDLVGRTIAGVTVAWPRTVATGARALARDLPGRQVTALARRAKYLLFSLSDGRTLLVHLRMTGRLDLAPPGYAPGRALRVDFALDNGYRLRFEDERKFGRVWLVDDPEQVTGALGPEPLAEDFTPALFRARLAGKARQLKPLLLDQAFIAGLGNIYTDEALNLARLHPLRRANSLSAPEGMRLYRAIRRTLEDAIANQGTSFDWAYRNGGYQERLRVYDRAGRECRRCCTPIVRTVVGQRGTYYCPRCQSLDTD